MKKFFALAVALIAMTATIFTSCSKDDDKDDDPNAFDKAVVQLNLDISKDLAEYFDITIGYVDFDGKSKSLKVTEAVVNSTDNFVTTSKNGKCTISYECKLKSGVTVNDQEVDLSITSDIREVCVNKSGKQNGGVKPFPYANKENLQYRGPLTEAAVKLFEISTSHQSVLENGVFK